MSHSEHPILLLLRAGDEPLRAYLPEVLAQEGFLCADALDLDAVAELPAALDGRALVLVSAARATGAEREALAAYVRKGGVAAFVAPPDDLVESLGVAVVERPHKAYGTANDGWLRIAEHPWVAGHDGALIQFHAPCRLWKLGGARALAWVAARKDEASAFPAIVDFPCGAGHAGIFWFDPARSALLTRQGDPLRASTGPLAACDGSRCYKPGQLFHGFLDPDLRDVPQADVLADLLAGVIRGLTDPRLPIPRLWHFPDGSPALTLFDGDSDSYDWDCYERLVMPAMEKGIPYTLNLTSDHAARAGRATVDAWFARGNDFELHYWPGSMMPTVAEMARCIPEQQRVFERSVGLPSVAARAHAVVWPGYTETAAALAESGFRMETNYFAFRGFQYGYCGSARPGRFMTPAGELLPISQQATVFMDDPMSNDKSLLPARSPEQAYDIMMRFYDASVTRWHGVLCTCLHPVTAAASPAFAAVQPAMRQAVIDGTLKHGLRAMNARDWSAFHEARRRVDLRYDGARWRVNTGVDLPDAAFLVPAASGVRRQGMTWEMRRRALKAGEAQVL
jgi:hypothetical protein